RAAGTGSMAPLWGRLGEVQVPVRCLAGEHDTKFCALGAQLADALPHGTFVTVPGAGHAAHFEHAKQTAAQVQAFLDEP
ncbi:MAG: alpha/beta fold hydrolase, partial [Actinomycetes bacterium]